MFFVQTILEIFGFILIPFLLLAIVGSITEHYSYKNYKKNQQKLSQ